MTEPERIADVIRARLEQGNCYIGDWGEEIIAEEIRRWQEAAHD